MNLSGLTSFITGTREFSVLAGLLGVAEQTSAVTVDAAMPALVASLRLQSGRSLLVITATPEKARRLAEQLRSWCAPSIQVLLFPEVDVLPFERLSSDQATSWERLRVLSALVGGETPVLVVSAPALASRTIDPSRFASAAQCFKPGSRIDVKATLARWVAMGYQSEQQVEVPGTFSQRGGILDVFSPGSASPVRIELFGDAIESLRNFNPATQRSDKAVDRVTIIPAQEFLLPQPDDKPRMDTAAGLEQYEASLARAGLSEEARAKLDEELAHLLRGESFPGCDFYASLLNNAIVADYLPAGSTVIIDNPSAVDSALKELSEQCSRLLQAKVMQAELPEGFAAPYFSAEHVHAKLDRIARKLRLLPWEKHGEEAVVMPFAPARSFGGAIDSVLEEAALARREGRNVVLVSYQASRLSELLEEKGIHAAPHDEIESVPEKGVVLVQGSLSQGWTLKGGDQDAPLTVLSDAEIFGVSKEARLPRNRPVRHQLLRSEISPGDYVVHIDHGIARFAGMTTIKRDCVDREYLVLEYADNDRIYVPVDSLDRVSRYTGAGATPALSRLRSGDWQKAKERVRKSVADIAGELLELHAWREVSKGIEFPQDPVWMQDLEKSFPYVETPDQLKAVAAVKSDMEKGRPMDRLVCGDVGYGKTEVALRAAFKAALGGKQVAVLVPTTILAQQHYVTFTDRLKPFPVKVAVLSRFCSEAEQQEALKGLSSGSIDICIGTHRMLQKDVSFKDLGLVIIDEEQRFGVAHKERLKKMRREVDVLTLSATPIPRTLHMALSGVRDISLVETPPEERLPVKTFVGDWENETAKEAMLRELKRNGQVLFVHNRVQSLHGVAAEVQTLVPEARIAVAHGQMGEDELECVMEQFVAGEKDILLCTTIIESGLDMPRANTLIVKEAEKLGLTQLYQLRGRVGRGSVRAYAYFFYNRGKSLTHQAEERLSTIALASELGAGFHIAMKDLEIRGAGNLLGAEQSGHIAAVGYDLYYRMLEEAVSDLKKTKLGQQPEKKAGPDLLGTGYSIELPVCGQLPHEYVADISTRIAVYRKLAEAQDEAEIAEVEADLNDRFGPLPVNALDLLYTARVRLLASQGGVESLSTENGQIVLRVAESRLSRLQLLAAVYRGKIMVRGNQVRLNLASLSGKWRELLPELLSKLAAVNHVPAAGTPASKPGA
ncbi:MAG: transcription-repair coupling factor [Chloroflexi bacterium]|nr:transcription-repair coupling factor [Chloroflexota bacterium]